MEETTVLFTFLETAKTGLSFIPVPPDKPIIRNQDGQEIISYEIGPYEIDEDLMIDCEVIGGEFN